MLKAIMKAEQKAKAHKDAVRELSLAFFDQLGNEELNLEEWEKTMRQLRMAEDVLSGRYKALWELRLDVSHSEEAESDKNYSRMNNSWPRYYMLSKELAA